MFGQDVQFRTAETQEYIEHQFTTALINTLVGGIFSRDAYEEFEVLADKLLVDDGVPIFEDVKVSQEDSDFVHYSLGLTDAFRLEDYYAKTTIEKRRTQECADLAVAKGLTG